MPLASFMIQVAFLFTNNYKLSFIIQLWVRKLQKKAVGGYKVQSTAHKLT